MHLSLMGSPVCRRGDKGPTPELNDGERGLVGVVGVFGVSGLLLLSLDFLAWDELPDFELVESLLSNFGSLDCLFKGWWLDLESVESLLSLRPSWLSFLEWSFLESVESFLEIKVEWGIKVTICSFNEHKETTSLANHHRPQTPKTKRE